MSAITVALPESRTEFNLRSVLTVLASALSGLAVAGMVLLIICTQFLGYHVLTVVSGSMTPTLSKGDVVLTRPVNVNKVRLHDIVLFQAQTPHHPVVIHRVAGFINVEMDTLHRSTGKTDVSHTRMLRTKGDANPVIDPSPVAPAQLKGALWFRIPGAGRLLGGSGLVKVLPFLAGLSGAVWLLSEVGARRRKPTVAA